jgi:hypothetical protein
MFQDKAQTAKNGASLRASWEAVVRGVTPLGKDQPLPARRA